MPEERAWNKSRDDAAQDGEQEHVKQASLSEKHSDRPTKKQRPEQQPQYVQASSPATMSINAASAAINADLVGSVVSTVVSSGKDALGLLFEAADQQEHDRSTSEPETSAAGDNASTQAKPGQCPAHLGRPVSLSTISDSVYQLWSASRFVKMGWLTPEEAVTYLDCFFRNMAALSPVNLDAYARVDGQYRLVTQEPLLCCAMLMISSRYHILPGAAGVSRGYFIHGRFWRHCQHLVMRLVFGQEKKSTAKTRTLGAIEGLILMSEWESRALHFPPESDGWDSDLLLTPTTATRPPASARPKGLEDVLDTARRSDRMSWMLLGCALSLSHELDVFADEDNVELQTEQQTAQIGRLRKLLYVSISQLAARQGSTSMLTYQASTINIDRNDSPAYPSSAPHDTFLRAWTELAKLHKSFSDIAFPSKSATRKVLRSGRYISILEHFQPLLASWADRYTTIPGMPLQMQDLLSIEYLYTQIYFSSLGMQAECEQVSSEGIIRVAGLNAVNEQKHGQEVITHTSALLERVIQLSERGVLRFAPIRVFLHATTASIFLLKGLAMGVRPSLLHTTLGILDRTVVALQSSVPDDIHMAHNYASLLRSHIARLRRVFTASTKSSAMRASRAQTPANRPQDADTASAATGVQHNTDHSTNDDLPFSDSFADDWLALPFDPTMAPLFPCGDSTETPLSFEGDNLDFLWNFKML